MGYSWHAEELSTVFAQLQTNENGLGSSVAAERLQENGPNALPAAKTEGYVRIFLRQFQSPLIYLLVAASAAICLVGEAVDGGIILFVLLFNAFVGAFQEGRAQNTLLALKRFAETTATVLRDGSEIVVPDSGVVVGDVLLLHEGEKVAADARIIVSNGLKADEAMLTGESTPSAKTAAVLSDAEVSTAEQKNMLFKGSTILIGEGRAVVVATGTSTVIGAIAQTVSTMDTQTPLQATIRSLSRAIIVVVAVVAVVVFLLGLWRGEPLVVIFATVVSLAVSIIPEGLPIVITLILATGVWRMSKRHALVKQLQAVEALGQAHVIAVDKTGTITKNELVVRDVWAAEQLFSVAGVGYDPVGALVHNGEVVDAANHSEILLAGKIAALSATAHVAYVAEERRFQVSGDPTEAAISVFGEKVGFRRDDLLRESSLTAHVPFDYRLKYHATLVREGHDTTLLVSGAPESVLARCSHVQSGAAVRALTAEEQSRLEQHFADMTDKGLRVVALAVRKKFTHTLEESQVHGLTLVALLGMQDVLRPEIAQAVSRTHAAGIRVVMITGDHAHTARAIAKEAGIWQEGDEVLLGTQIDALSDAELSARIGTVSVFARVSPEHKLRIIMAYKRRKEVIAMTGDGVNDAPSLVAADLGVAMGQSGTEVAREAADIVLLDDNFTSIVSAVEEGRSIYKTIQKVVLYLFSTSLGEVATIVGALIIGYPLPLLAAQIIWLNFVTDGFLDVALAMEPKEEGLLSGMFVRPKKYLLDGLMLRRMVLMALPMVVGTLFLFEKYVGGDLETAWTVSLTTLAVFQWCNAWNCRSTSQSVFRGGLFTNKYLLGATAIVVALQLLAIYTPFLQHILHTAPLGVREWLLMVPTACSVIMVEEVRKLFARRRARRQSQHPARLARVS